MATIADILMAQGRSAREARMARGGVWAPLVQQLSNLPAAMLEDRDRRRAAEAQAAMQAEDRALKQRSDEQAYALNQQRLSEGERTAAARTAKIEILSNAVEEDGSFNLPKAMALIDERGWGDVVDPEDLKTWDQQYDQQAYARARQVQQDDRQLAQDRQAENQRGVRRMIGESIQSRGGQPLSPQEAQTYQGMAFQEGLTLPEGLMPQAEEEVSMVVRGPGGRPTRVLVPKSQLRNGGMEEYREPKAATSDSEPLVVIAGPDGRPIYVPRSQAVGKAPASSQSRMASGLERRALNFYNRAAQADKDLEDLEPQIQELGLGGQARMQYAPNVLQTQLGQQYTQAQRAFTEARLRKDSGAAIPEQEFENDRKTYFAQPGDSQQTLQQKRRARAAVLASLGFESGQALAEYLGDPQEAQRIVGGYRQRAEGTNQPQDRGGSWTDLGNGVRFREKP